MLQGCCLRRGMPGQEVCMRAVLLACTIGCTLIGGAAAQDEMDGCGGFVRPAGELTASQEKPDLSVVKAALVTSDGLVKSQTECSPNGYYFIPIYDKGSYKIRIQGPPGWMFSPQDQEVSTSEGLCAQGKDIDFEITGFALAGKVCSEGSSEGPAGVTMTLQGKDGKFTTVTKEGGIYSFDQAKPGQMYTITAHHPTWKFRTSSVQAKLEFGHAEVRETFGVLGYPVQAKIAWQSSDPVSGLQFLLKRKDGSPRPADVQCALAGGKGDGVWCSVITDSTGILSFDNIPLGEYILSLDASAAGKIEIEPTSVGVSVSHGAFKVDGQFSLVGFSISGRVIDAAGAGVSSADVYVDGKKSAVTDTKGSYTVQIQAGKHTVTAKKEHYIFSELRDYDLSPQLKRVSSLSAEAYALNGKLSLDSASPSKRTITLNADKGGASQTTQTDESGKFSFMAAPGEYTLKAQSISGVLITPQELKVSTKDGPKLNARFVQASLHIQGKVLCADGCDKSVSVSIKGTMAKVGKLDGTGGFSFENVETGKYTVSVVRDGWCWEKESIDVTVGKEDTTALYFKQSGVSATVTSSHAAKITLKAPDKEGEDLDLSQGQQRVCMKHAAVYSVSPHPCLNFEGNPILDTKSRPTLSLKVTQELVKVRVTTPSKIPSLFIDVGSASPIKADEPQRDGSRWSYDVSHWTNLGESVTVTPSAPGSGLLFSPASSVVRASGGASCSKPLAVFEARGGRVFKGSVKPGMAGVEIVVSEAGGLQKMVGSVVTPDDGSFSLGPFQEDVEYSVRAEKQGYIFVQDSDGGFRSVRMGDVGISVLDDTGNALQGVLLSLSGDSGFRQNNRTAADGAYTFYGLQPGTYFLRPMLKEYNISPGTLSISVQEGVNPLVSLEAKRVAFSVFGKVTTLDGKAEKSATVTAVAFGGGGTLEETISDAAGEYRLRGLKPGERYTIAIKMTSDARHERATPAAKEVTVGKGDEKDVNFLVFRRPSKLDISGRVNASVEHLPSIKVEISTQANPGNTLHTVSLMASNYFEFPSMPRDKYLLKVTASLDKRGYKISTEAVQVILEGEAAFVTIPFSAVPRNSVDEAGPTSFWFLFIIVAGVIAYLNRQELMEKINATPAAPSASDKATDYYTPKSEAPKKKNK